MKNSPGSMIGGIGLTTCVREVQFARTISRMAPTFSSSAPTVASAPAARTPEEDLAGLLELATSGVGGDLGSVFLWDAERGGLALAAAAGLPEGTESTLEAAVARDPR